MGGCRCSFRNCTVRSDGQTHMFHYPVFDKVRCHQWLTNADRLEFLNLKVSQLKNRVVCQHHFNDNDFMNFKMDKLKFDAVPTEYGPFCTASNDWNNPNISQNITQEYPIILEDIENDQLTCKEKLANFSVKYGDFLTNYELMDPTMLNPRPQTKDLIELSDIIDRNKDLAQLTNTDTTSQNKDLLEMTNITFSTDRNLNESNILTTNSKVSLFNDSSKKYQPMLVVQPFLEFNNAINSTILCNQLVVSETNNNLSQINDENNGYNVKQLEPVSNLPSNQNVKRNSGVRIISEKKITKPLPFKGQLEPLSPSLILRGQNRKTKNDDAAVNVDNTSEAKIESQIPCKSENVMDSVQLNEFSRSENIRVESEKVQNKNNLTPLNNENNRSSFQASPGDSLIKNKITPERFAAIEEKRKFNKRLRDMVAFCLDELDDNKKNIIGMHKTANRGKTKLQNDKMKNTQPVKSVKANNDRNITTRSAKQNRKIQQGFQLTKVQFTSPTTMQRDNNELSEKVDSFLSQEPSLPSLGGYSFASLETRIKRMEDTLLRKIDQNAERIVDLKKSITQPYSKVKCKTTQTIENEESYKHRLFKEISKFLSPDTSNLIYEELFYNKYKVNDVLGKEKPVQESSKYSQPPKRRRHR